MVKYAFILVLILTTAFLRSETEETERMIREFNERINALYEKQGGKELGFQYSFDISEMEGVLKELKKLIETKKTDADNYLNEQEFYDFLVSKKPIYKDIKEFYLNTLKDPKAQTYYSQLIKNSKRLSKLAEKGFYLQHYIQQALIKDFPKQDPNTEWIFHPEEALLKSYEAFLRSLENTTDKKIPYWRVLQLAKDETYKKHGIPDSLPIEELGWRYPNANKTYKDNLAKFEDETHRKRDKNPNDQDELLKLWFKKSEEKLETLKENLYKTLFYRGLGDRKKISFYSDNQTNTPFAKPEIVINTDELKNAKVKIDTDKITFIFSDEIPDNHYGYVTQLRRNASRGRYPAGLLTTNGKGKILSIELHTSELLRFFPYLNEHEKHYFAQILRLDKKLPDLLVKENSKTPQTRANFAARLRQEITKKDPLQYPHSDIHLELKNYFSPEKINELEENHFKNFLTERMSQERELFAPKNIPGTWRWFGLDHEPRYKHRYYKGQHYYPPSYTHPNRKNILRILSHGFYGGTLTKVKSATQQLSKNIAKGAAILAVGAGLVVGGQYLKSNFSSPNESYENHSSLLPDFLSKYWPSWLTFERNGEGSSSAFTLPENYESYNKGGDRHGQGGKKGPPLFSILPQGKDFGFIPKIYDVPSKEDIKQLHFSKYSPPTNIDKEQTHGFLVVTKSAQIAKDKILPILSSHGAALENIQIRVKGKGLLTQGRDYEIYHEPTSNLYYAHILTEDNHFSYEASFFKDDKNPKGDPENIKIDKNNLKKEIAKIETAGLFPLASHLKDVLKIENPSAKDVEHAFHEAAYYSYRKEKRKADNAHNEYSRFTKFLFEDYLGWQCDTAEDAFRKALDAILKRSSATEALKQQVSFVPEAQPGKFLEIHAGNGHARTVLHEDGKLYEFDATPHKKDDNLIEAKKQQPKITAEHTHMPSMNDLIFERRRLQHEGKGKKDPINPELDPEKPVHEETKEAIAIDLEEGVSEEVHNLRKANLDKQKKSLLENPFYKKIPRNNLSQDLPSSRALVLGRLLGEYSDRDLDFDSFRKKVLELFPMLKEKLQSPQNIKSFLKEAFNSEVDSIKKMQKLIADRKVTNPKYTPFGNDIMTDSIRDLMSFYTSTDWTPIKKSCKQMLNKIAA